MILMMLFLNGSFYSAVLAMLYLIGHISVIFWEKRNDRSFGEYLHDAGPSI